MEKLAIGMGELLWDIFADGKKLGGAPANFAYHVGQLGFDSCVISAVGKDDLGIEALEALRSKGIGYEIAETDYPTGTVRVNVDDKGIPQYEITENVAWDNIPYSDNLNALASRCVAFCFGSLAQRNEVSRHTIDKFIECIPAENNAMIVFDVNLRQHFYSKELLDTSMRRCNVLKINDEELYAVAELFDVEGGGIEILAQKIKDNYDIDIVIVTCGAEGSYVITDSEVSFKSTPVVDLVDTVGAGDSFTAAFVASILQGESVDKAHARAVAVAAYVCTQHGAMPALKL